MSKVEELKLKYAGVHNASFQKIVEGDKTPTKKYLEYMLKMWSNRHQNRIRATTVLISAVSKFESLLPYIVNKDIYDSEYKQFTKLLKVIEEAEAVKDEKTFVKEEHCDVILENDEYIFLRPTTIRGSLKYGANTKWCTASKGNPGLFDRYTKNGLLVYLIDKKGNKKDNVKKVAFYTYYNNDGITGGIELYNTLDTVVAGNALTSGGWGLNDLFKITTAFRAYFVEAKKMKEAKGTINTFISQISNLNFEGFAESVKKLEQSVDISYITNAQEKVGEFLNSIKKIQDAI